MQTTKKLIRFDWAMKKLLRNKANFDILEGFLSELLSEDIHIQQILDSESNKESENDKYNRVDILVTDSSDRLMIVEVQNSKELDYFHRILFGTSKAISEHIQEGQNYAHIKKVISITIAYFDLGQGKDYVYHGINQFRGIHAGDVLCLSDKQQEIYQKTHPHQIFPEYWLIKVEKFNDLVQDKLDEWIYFLKNGQVKSDFSAKGLDKASEKLTAMSLPEKERKAYAYYLKRLRDIASENYNKAMEVELLLRKERRKAEKARKKTAEKVRKETAEKVRKETTEKVRKETTEKVKKEMLNQSIVAFYKIGISIEDIAKAQGISVNQVKQIIEQLA